MKWSLLAVLLCMTWEIAGQQNKKIHQDQSAFISQPWEPEYMFPVAVTMVLTSFDNGAEKDMSQLRFYANDFKNWQGMSWETMDKKNMLFMIFDNPRNVGLSLNKADKTGETTSLDNIKGIEGHVASINNGYSARTVQCKHTGKKKIILGYECQQIICSDLSEDARWELWVTNKLSFDYTRIGANSFPFANKISGFGLMLEGTFYKNEQLESHLLVTDFNQRANVVVKPGWYNIEQR